MNKNRHIIGELQEFFANNDSSKAINSISTIMNSIRIQSKVIGSVKNPNCKFTCLQVLQLLVLFPFFSIKNAANYSSSALGRMFVCHKDMFYRFMNDGNVNWRRITYSFFRQLYSRVKRSTTLKSDIRCVIIDDTDLPKTGFKTEKIGKVFSHTQMKPILGFKAMFLCFTAFFSIKNAANYSSSALGRMFVCHKDMFYRFMNDGNVNWRRITYSFFRQLYSRVKRSTTLKSDIRCVIIDDTDLPKTGFKTEKIGKVFSHTQMKPILGFKAMFLCFTDGISQFLLDFSLHGEEGKRSDKPQGLSKKQTEERYCKEHSGDERIVRRSTEYFASKIETAISMLKRSIIEGVRFDYLLVDSWFTCSELLKFVVSRHFGCHLIGMIKMGKTKYETDLGNKTAPELIKALQKSRKVKYSRSIGYYTTTVSAKISGVKVSLFFYRRGRNGNWNALLTSDLKLGAKEAFRLYSRRWVIEVAHKEMKQNLKLGKNQCRDFAGQIAGISLCVLQYNILSYVKRNESYETIGGLFAEISKNSVELSVAEKIWLLIVEVINVIAEVLNCDAMLLTEQIISNDKQIKAVKLAFDRLTPAA